VLFFYVIPIRKKVVIRNLSFAFPDKNQSEIKQLALQNYISIAISFLEISLFGNMSKEQVLNLSEKVDFTEVLNSGSEKKGQILLTAHFGNWELGALLVGLNMNKCVTVLAKDQKNKLVAGRLREMRERFGNREVYLGVAVRELYKTLLNGNPIGVVADQRAPKSIGIKVEFFGRETYVFSGFGNLALKLHAPIFILLITRQSDGKYKILFEEISYDNLPDDKDGAIQILTQRYISILEANIRKHPEQWFWMHNIWKH
jgi:KDO2-lipid IV(A) lauroyltransferase